MEEEPAIHAGGWCPVVVGKLRHLRTGGPKGGPLPEVLYGRRKMTAWLARNDLPGVPEHTVGRLIAISSRTTWRCSRARGGEGERASPSVLQPRPAHSRSGMVRMAWSLP